MPGKLQEGKVIYDDSFCGNCRKTANQLTNEDKTLLKCMGCKMAQYCSKDCQRKNWKLHKDFCRNVPKTPAGSYQPLFLPESLERLDFCKECGKTPSELEDSEHELRKCLGCNIVKYCSQECREKNWPKHKKCCERDGRRLKDTDTNYYMKSMDGLYKELATKVDSITFSPDEDKCVECKKSERQLQDENKSLKKCRGCNIAKYCGEQCQILNYPKHKNSCLKLKQCPEIPTEYKFVVNENGDIGYRRDMFVAFTVQLNCMIEICAQCRITSKIEELLELTESIVCSTWNNSFPCFRFVIPSLLLHLGRDDDAINCIYYIIFEHGKDAGKYLNIDSSSDSFIHRLRKRDKYKDILEEDQLSGDYFWKIFGASSPFIYCGVLFLTYIGVKLNIIKDLVKRMESGEKGLDALFEEQMSHWVKMYHHMVLFYDPIIQKATNSVPIALKGIGPRADFDFLNLRLNLFCNIVQLKLLSNEFNVVALYKLNAAIGKHPPRRVSREEALDVRKFIDPI